MTIVGQIPAHRIMMTEAGYNTAFYHMADFPEAFDALVESMERAYRSLWIELAGASARRPDERIEGVNRATEERNLDATR